MLMDIFVFFFFQAEDGIRDVERSRGLGDVYKRQLFCCLQPFTYLRVHRMPVLFPTKYMLEKYGKPDSPPAEVYANVAQDIFSKTFGLPKSDISLQQKEDFFQYLFGSDKGNFKLDQYICLLYTSDAADDTPCVDLGGRRIIKKKTLSKKQQAMDRQKENRDY
eukprot:TRINITY_DN37062_c0_g1_i1.p1 TRINITY_DN37062_c0_g1~~TRINITY_DN37062_c0_g1_i1.p1  ORF type:complete len:163 (-),score=44.79 TRINITY_DN37062_c0_g1_i1:51-539(-)